MTYLEIRDINPEELTSNSDLFFNAGLAVGAIVGGGIVAVAIVIT